MLFRRPVNCVTISVGVHMKNMSFCVKKKNYSKNPLVIFINFVFEHTFWTTRNAAHEKLNFAHFKRFKMNDFVPNGVPPVFCFRCPRPRNHYIACAPDTTKVFNPLLRLGYRVYFFPFDKQTRPRTCRGSVCVCVCTTFFPPKVLRGRATGCTDSCKQRRTTTY